MGKVIDHGNYRPERLSEGMRVGKGESVSRVYLLGAAAGQEAELPESIFIGLPPEGFILEEDSALDIAVLVLPGCSARIPLTVELEGKGARAGLSGLFLSGGEDKVSFDIQVRHLAEGCSSNQLFNGIASGKASCSFSGKIVVAPGAQKTEAFQQNRNILLSTDARIDTKPQLEIYADDVKCSHGATVGQLDEEALFYLRSRGIPEALAKSLQLLSFIAPVVSALPETLRDPLGEVIEAAVGQLLR